MKITLRSKIFLLSFFMILIPSLILGTIGYRVSLAELDNSGKIMLKNHVKSIANLIEDLNIEVEKGTMSLDEAQERVKVHMLGEKNNEGKRPINKDLYMGEFGYMFVLDETGLEVAHPSLEGKIIMGLKDSDGNLLVDHDSKPVAEALIEKAKSGGGYTIFDWELPNSTQRASKITYSELDPHWGWIINAGSYMSDFNSGATKVLYMLMLTLVISVLLGGILAYWFSNKLTGPLNKMIKKVELVAVGDLSGQKLHIKTKDEIGLLGSSTNNMVDTLRNLIGEVSTNALSLSKSTQQISSSADEMARGSQEQALLSNQATELVKEMTIAMYEVAVNAEQAANVTDQTVQMANQGRKVINDTIKGMEEINLRINELSAKSMQIGEIIEVIDEIAEQTNLLALNAAIEAARAGALGKGFAVVADEVRKLAERSSKATKEISILIKSIQVDTDASVTSVNNGNKMIYITGKTFEEIVQGIQESANKVNSIAAASQQQATQTQEVLVAVENISAVTEQTAAGTEETATIASELSIMAERLNELTRTFKLR